ncbi:PLP-dependent aminotransferase family protein [Serpentinicella alkaliphila]|uniref:GntR family transcriptional regulator/MocR family aminotransferase n=1 Tax=Serpentinicella alkaliphila TaxID=1734049 RepID=A0A4R2U2H5_9FIRM|nr:PLP-dependent aminotransferase family protein [Serpentinicella alkaliphila]QUH26784.1 PLP-dependent aminotransferase family protein [Serpentinicella alkaliphila]TCQ08005.1 GntR family transcriptional regulator/MocR family aminotransferase [Serpentinicella alkaliphila]
MHMLMFSGDLDSKVPIYHQLYSYIKSEIQLGRIAYNSKLPSKRKLASYLSISQNTIQNAYDQLIEEGYVISRERKGYYVCKIDNITKIDLNIEYPETNQKINKYIVKYDFSYNGVDMQTFPFSTWRKFTKDIISEYDLDLLQLGDSQGNENLRTSIAEYLHQSRGVNCSPNQIIVSAGTESLMQIIIQLLHRDSVYGIENPGYEKLNLLFSSNHIKFKGINIDEGGMIIKDIIKNKADVLCITPAHQFPSGEIMPINRRVQILNWANEKNGRYIIEDDYDGEFKYSGKPIPALQGLDANEKVIYIGAFSKSLSPSVRVSYMVLPPHLVKRYREKLSYIICPVPIINQKVLYKFIHEGYFERHLNKMRNIYKKKRETLVKKLLDLNCGIKIFGADAGLHLLISFDNGMTEEQLVASALEDGVKVYGLSKYFYNKHHVEKIPKILLGYATMTEEQISDALEILRKTWFKDVN